MCTENLWSTTQLLESSYNETVLSYVNAPKLSDLLLEQQLLVFGKIFRKPNTDTLRKAVFEEDSDVLKLHTKRRGRGRPKLAWSVEVRKMAQLVTTESLRVVLGNEVHWKKLVRKFCRSPSSETNEQTEWSEAGIVSSSPNDQSVPYFIPSSDRWW